MATGNFSSDKGLDMLAAPNTGERAARKSGIRLMRWLGLLPLLLAAPAVAQQRTYWTAGTGDWFDASNWDSGLPDFDTGAGIVNGGTVEVKDPNAEAWQVLLEHGSALEISENGELDSTFGIIWGDVTVTGGANWTNWTVDQLNVGDVAPISPMPVVVGTLTLESGGSVYSSDAAIGNSRDTTGEVTVTGPHSTWNNEHDFYVGNEGRGTLTIEDSGHVNELYDDTVTLAHADGSHGTINIGSGGSPGILNTPKVHGGDGTAILNFNHSDPDHFFTSDGTAGGTAVTITGSTAVNHIGTGTTILTGNNTYTGLTTIRAGTLRIGNGGTSGSISGNTVNHSVLAFDRSDDSTYGGAISGSGTVAKYGAGRLTLPGANSYTGGTTINAGILSVSSDDNLGDASGGLTLNGGTLQNTAAFNTARGIALGGGGGTFNTAADLTATGVISGAGALTKTGTGRLTLTGTNTYTGGTTVEAGTLMVEGTLGGTMTVASGGALGGNGTLGGATTIASGGTLLGRQGKVLRFGSDLTLANGANINVALGRPETTGLFDVTGNLSLDGQLNVTDLGGFSEGLYRLFDYGGSLTDKVLDIGTVPHGVDRNDVSVQTSDNQINLINTTGVTLRFWDGGDPANHDNDAVNGGDGVWNVSNDNWTEADGALNGPWSNGHFAIFEGQAGTVAVDDANGAISVTGMQFATDGYRVEGDAITLERPETIIRTGFGSRAGANVTATIASELTGTGGLTKTDFGTLVLTGANSYTGGTFINEGTLSVSADDNLGGASGGLTFDGGTLQNTAAFTTGRGVTLNAGGGTFQTDADLTLTGDIAGAGALTKTGGGTLVVTGDNTYTGGTWISAGTLQVGDGGTSGAITGDVVNHSALVFNRSDSLTYGGIISGTGTVNQQGAGTLTLTGTNTYSGSTTIEAGTLQVGDGGTSGAITGDVTNNGILAFNRSDTLTFAGVINGSGGVEQRGGGTTILTRDSGGFAGSTTVRNGTLVVDGILGGTLDVMEGGRLGGSGTVGTTTMGGTIAPGDSIGTLIVGGDLTVGSGAVYEVEVDPAGSASDLIQVAGTAHLEGGPVVHIGLDGTYAQSSSYTILSADGGIEGAFGPVSSDFAFLDAEVGYVGNDAILRLLRNDVDFVDEARTHNQRAVARTLDEVEAGVSGDLKTVVETVVGLDGDEARAAFEQLSGEAYATLAGLMMDGHALFGQTVTRRLAMLRAARPAAEPLSAGAMAFTGVQLASTGLAPRLNLAQAALAGGALGSEPVREGLWARGYGTFGDVDGDGNAGGADATFRGIAFGLDHRLTPDLLGGIILNYASADIDFDRGGSGDVDGYTIGSYGSYEHGPVYVDAVASYTYLDNAVDRPVTVGDLSRRAKADYAGHRGAGYIETGYRFALSHGLELQPLAAVQYTYLHQEGFREDGAGDIDLLGESGDTHSFKTGLGMRLSRTFALADGAELVPELRARWQHEFLDDHATLDAAFAGAPDAGFTVKGVETARDSAVLGFGITARNETNFALFIDYDAKLNADQTGHNVTGGIRFTW